MSVTVGSRRVNEGDPRGERDAASERTGGRKEVDSGREGSHCVVLPLVGVLGVECRFC
jgi:hypothetical protein